MKHGPDIALPPIRSLAHFYLGQNLELGRGDKIAVYWREQAATFRDISRLANRFGNVLQRLGVGHGTRVLLVLDDSPEWLGGWFGAMKIGAVATHAYTYLLAQDYEYFLGYVLPAIVVVDAGTLPNVRAAARHVAQPVVLLVAGADLPSLEPGEFALNALLAEAPDSLDVPPPLADDCAFWNFSGGTTGKPKGVAHSHAHGVIGCESFLHEIPYRSDDIVLRVPKLFFHYSRDLGMNWALHAGAAICLCPGRMTAERVFELIAKHRPSILLNVPTMMRAMLQSPLAKSADLSSIRFCISSGELLSASLYEEFTRTFGVEVINSHGSAETYLACFVDRPGQVRPGSSGRIMPLVDVALVDEHGHEVADGETGVLRVRSDASGACYHLEPEKSAATFLGENWINTNDLFREDTDGYFWFVGRANDLIKVSGVYVAPAEIENRLSEHQSVAECVVLAAKDEDELVKTRAFIVLRPGFVASDQLAKELKTFCQESLASYKAPKSIEFRSELPKNGQGKIDKLALVTASPGNESTVHATSAV